MSDANAHNSKAVKTGKNSAFLTRIVPVLVLLGAMVVVFAMGWHRALTLESLVAYRDTLEAFIRSNYVLALAGFLALYITVVALSIPGAAFLTLAGGFLFGWLVGGLVVILGATIGAALVFLIARSACGDALLRRGGVQTGKLVEGFRASAFNYLLFLRLVPLFPFWAVNLAPAIAGVKLSTFIAATAIGIIPGTMAFALAGASLGSVILAQETAYRACLSAGRADCMLNFDLRSAITPQVLIALTAIGIMALVPVLWKRWRARSCKLKGDADDRDAEA